MVIYAIDEIYLILLKKNKEIFPTVLTIIEEFRNYYYYYKNTRDKKINYIIFVIYQNQK